MAFERCAEPIKPPPTRWGLFLLWLHVLNLKGFSARAVNREVDRPGVSAPILAVSRSQKPRTGREADPLVDGWLSEGRRGRPVGEQGRKRADRENPAGDCGGPVCGVSGPSSSRVWGASGPCTWVSGQLAEEVALVGGVRNGPFRAWSAQGILVSEGAFAEGRPDGLWRSWRSDGALVGETTYDKGAVVSSKRAM